MAGTAVTRRLSRLEYGFAGPADDAGLRALLRETPMDGSVRLTLEREPSFFGTAHVEGERHHTIYAREAGKIVAMASRNVHTLFVNGTPTRIGYLSQLRIATSHRQHTRQFLRTGFAMLHETHAADEAPFDITTIITDNSIARRLLEAGLPNLPHYQFVDRILTMLLPVGRGREQLPRAMSVSVPTGYPYQFSSVVPPMSLPMVQVERQGRVVGSAIIWDQRKFKQVVVRGYSRAMERWRWLLRLPAVGTALPLVYLSHFAVPAHDPNVCVELVDTGLAAARAMGCRWLVLGLTARHPLAPVVQWRYRPRRYESRLYVVHEPGTRVQLDGRIPHVEVALL